MSPGGGCLISHRAIVLARGSSPPIGGRAAALRRPCGGPAAAEGHAGRRCLDVRPTSLAAAATHHLKSRTAHHDRHRPGRSPLSGTPRPSQLWTPTDRRPPIVRGSSPPCCRRSVRKPRPPARRRRPGPHPAAARHLCRVGSARLADALTEYRRGPAQADVASRLSRPGRDYRCQTRVSSAAPNDTLNRSHQMLTLL